jgi:glycosyltransferase involved in cell wall biosynthesis
MQNENAVVDISVIVRTKDRPFLLARALHSLSLQTSRSFEVIIVNDGGDAEPVEGLIAEYSLPDSIVVTNAESVGRAKAFNQGMQIARGPFIACLDDDDTYQPLFIERMATEMHAALLVDPKMGGLVCRCTEIYEELLKTPSKVYTKFTDNIRYLDSKVLFHYNSADNFISPYFYFVQRENFLPVQAIIRRDLLMQFGGFSETNDVLEDRPVYQKIVAASKIMVLDEQLANHHTRVTKDGTTNSNSMHDNTSYNWGKRFAEFYNEGYYDKQNSENFYFTIIRDAMMDMKWEMSSEHTRRANANFTFYQSWRNIWKLMRKNKIKTALAIFAYACSMIAFSAIGTALVLYI